MKTTQRKSGERQAPKGKQRVFRFRGGIEEARTAKLTEKNKVIKGIMDFKGRLSSVRVMVLGVYRQYLISKQTDLRFRAILQAYLTTASHGPVGATIYGVKALARKFKRLLQKRERFVGKLGDLHRLHAALHTYCDMWMDSFQKYVWLVENAKSVTELEAVPFPNPQGLEKINVDFGADALVTQWENMALLVKMDEYTNLLGYLVHPRVQQVI